MFNYLFNKNIVFDNKAPETIESQNQMSQQEAVGKAKSDLQYAENQFRVLKEKYKIKTTETSEKVTITSLENTDQDLKEDVQKLVEAINNLRSFIKNHDEKKRDVINSTFDSLTAIQSNLTQKGQPAAGDPLSVERFRIIDRPAYVMPVEEKKEKVPTNTKTEKEKPVTKEELSSDLQRSIMYKISEWVPSTVDEKPPVITNEEITEIKRLSLTSQPTNLDGNKAYIHISTNGKVARIQLENTKEKTPGEAATVSKIYSEIFMPLVEGAVIKNARFSVQSETEKETSQIENNKAQIKRMVERLETSEVPVGSYVMISATESVVQGKKVTISQFIRKDIDGFSLLRTAKNDKGELTEKSVVQRFVNTPDNLKILLAMTSKTAPEYHQVTAEKSAEVIDRQTKTRMQSLLHQLDEASLFPNSSVHDDALAALDSFVAKFKPVGEFSYESVLSNNTISYDSEKKELYSYRQDSKENKEPTRTRIASFPLANTPKPEKKTA